MDERKSLRKQILDIIGNDITEEKIQNICLINDISIGTSETVYLYLSNSKDGVAEILDIDSSTVIRRLKRFIERAKEV